MEINSKIYIVAIVAIFAVAAYGISYNVAQAASHNASSGTTGTYDLTLVITTENVFNQSVGTQPAYYVLQNGTLQSSAVISLPQGKTISLTIINYDDGPASVPSQYDKVIGTTNSQIAVFNNTNINSTEGPNGINVDNASVVSQVSDSNIAHTFTVFSGTNPILNIPIEPTSIVHATFTLSTGSYTWQCEAACGSGPAGWSGAMSTPGWMTGTLEVV